MSDERKEKVSDTPWVDALPSSWQVIDGVPCEVVPIASARHLERVLSKMRRQERRRCAERHLPEMYRQGNQRSDHEVMARARCRRARRSDSTVRKREEKNMRRAAKVDANQQEVIDALRRCSVAVEFIGKPLDLLICHRGESSVMEVKNPDGKNQLTKDQVAFIARWPGKIHIVHSVDEALHAVLGEEHFR